ncbi:type III-A CRISPR-associated RAMP protein Csm3 [Desulfofundulus sp.]|uniref:type III-A CRISPR-associated RAMP protein Csm3 n=1 Tax=Desulfofundulus sp. TaxID=2282750 RepID=UPI003C7399C9
MKLLKHITIKGKILCETGLRIGGSKDDIEIGGMDNPIIRHPVTGLPYIPGSSLKGRMRALLELKYSSRTQSTGQPCGCGEESCKVCRIFGAHKNMQHRLGPTRLIVRDAFLTDGSEQVLREAQQEKGLFFAEIKTENWVDRKTGRAGHGGLRTQERVPAGTSFNFELVLRVFEGDKEQDMLNIIKEGLALVQREYLGSSGSRGYGKVRFEDITVDGEAIKIGEGM